MSRIREEASLGRTAVCASGASLRRSSELVSQTRDLPCFCSVAKLKQLEMDMLMTTAMDGIR